MKFAFVVNNFPPRLGGVENHVAELSKNLVSLGHQVLVVTLEATSRDEKWSGVRVIALREHVRISGILGFPGWGTRRRLTALLRSENVDVVSTHTRFFPMSWVGLRAAKCAQIPVVHTEHGSGHVVSASPLISAASRIVDYTVGRAVMRQADEVLGVSEAVTAFVKNLSGRSSRVFYNAIPDLPAVAPLRLRPEHLVFVGRIVPGKGWEAFVAVVEELRLQGYPVTGEVLGDGADMTKLVDLIGELSLEDVVMIRGRMPAQEVRAALSGATLVNPTVLSEGFQTTLLEALAETAQIVTYSVPGAEALRSAGHPVRVTASRDVHLLTQAVANLIDSKQPAKAKLPLDAWYWPTRAREYADLCAVVVRSGNAR